MYSECMFETVFVFYKYVPRGVYMCLCVLSVGLREYVYGFACGLLW